jgi:AbrB family looped-hinge helix DNA binding protein
MKATVSSKRRVTIPAAICRQANIIPGAKLDFQIGDDGVLIVYLLTDDISKLKGIVKSKR